MSIVQDLVEQSGLPCLAADAVDAFLAAPPAHKILFFAGDPAQRMETADVAVIFPQLLRHFAGRLEGALIAAGSETELKERFHVGALPSLVVTRGAETLGVFPKVWDWAVYVARIEAMLAPGAPVLTQAPRVQFTYSGKGARA